MARSVSSLVNLVALLMLVFFIYSSIAVTLYGTMCVDGEERLPGMGQYQSKASTLVPVTQVLLYQ
jgi:hypothetical protein